MVRDYGQVGQGHYLDAFHGRTGSLQIYTEDRGRTGPIEAIGFCYTHADPEGLMINLRQMLYAHFKASKREARCRALWFSFEPMLKLTPK